MSTTTPPPGDREPDNLLSPEEVDVRRHYASLSQPEPGPELDARVRRMAGQALDEDAIDSGTARDTPICAVTERGRSRTDGHVRGRQRGSGRRGPRVWWLAAAGSAAVAVLAVGLMRHQHIGPPATQPPVRVDHASESKVARRVVNSATGHALSATRAPALKPGPKLSLPERAERLAPEQPKPVRPAPTPAPALAPALPAPSSPAAKLSFRAVPSSSMRASSEPEHTPRTPASKQRSADTGTKALQHIRELFAHDKSEQALDLLKAFHKTHPDRQLPADLRARLPGK